MKKVHKSDRTNKLHLPRGYSVGRYEIRTVRLENILDQIWGSRFPLKIKNTPHFKYLTETKHNLESTSLSAEVTHGLEKARQTKT